MLDLLSTEVSALDCVEQLQKTQSIKVSKLFSEGGLRSAPQSSMVSVEVFQLLDAAKSRWEKTVFLEIIFNLVSSYHGVSLIFSIFFF